MIENCRAAEAQFEFSSAFYFVDIVFIVVDVGISHDDSQSFT
jgi:hypothetical protein